MITTDYYNIISSSDKSKFEELAFEYLVVDTLDKNLHGSSKSKQVTGLDLESALGHSILPSLVYTFKYNSEHIDKDGKYQFKDYVPVIFCMGVIDGYVYGINFNLLPNNIRAVLLDCITDLDPEFYNKGAYSEGVQLSREVIKLLSTEDNKKVFFNYLKSKVGLDVSKAYRKYNIKSIENLRLIEYDVWEYIPHLVFKDAIRGANLIEIQKSMIPVK